MAAPSFPDILKKRLRRLRLAVVAAEKTACQKERLHQLRVQLKKWRAALLLLRAVDPEFPYPEVYKPFKALFSRAGQVRFWQLQQHILNESAFGPPTFARQYGDYVHCCIRDAQKDFSKTAEKAGLPKWRDVKNELRQSCSRCTPAAVQAYFENLETAIAVLRKNPGRRLAIELHELRKILKEYANNRQLATKYLGLDPGPPTGLPSDHAAFDELLGEWHDQDVACARLAEDLRTQGWEGDMLREGKAVLRGWKKKERAMWGEVAARLR